MYILRIVFEIIVSLFAIFGLYSAGRLISQKFFGDKRIVLTVIFRGEESIEDAEMLIRCAMEGFLLTSSSRICALVPVELLSNEELISIFRRYGVQYYGI